MRKFVEMRGDWDTLNIVPPHTTIVGRCLSCGVEREIDRKMINDRAGNHAWIQAVERRLKCSNCGAKDAKLFFGYYAAET